MFTLANEYRFAWPVSVSVPGAAEPQQFEACFRALPQSRIEARAGDAPALLREALVGWSGVRDEAMREVPFTEAARDALLDLPFVLVALANAYADAMSGAALRKN